MKTSKIFDGKKFVPAHVGVYSSNHPKSNIIIYRNFNGKYWCLFSFDISGAIQPRHLEESAYQDLDWWGLAEEAKGKP